MFSSSSLWRAGVLLLLCSVVQGKVYFKETFDDSWADRWTKSSWKVKEGAAGDFVLSAGDFYGDAKEDRGIKTTPDARFFAWSSPLTEPFDNEGKDLVLQFSVKHEQKIDCGGGYIKLIPESSKDEMKDFSGDTPYLIMFGPDICGYQTKRVHVILKHKDENHLIKKDIKCQTDQLTHLYTLHVKPDNTYRVLIDLEEVESGDLFADWSMVPPRKIKDPDAKKPDDWDEREKIPDPEDEKPDDWDDQPEFITDPDATQPEDWDEEEDGAWEAPNIPNPDFKGKWKPKMIENPDYKGKWVAPEIDNPEFVEDNTLYHHPGIGFVAFELWQVKAGSIFDNIILSDDFKDAESLAKKTFLKNKDAERDMFEKQKEQERERETAEMQKMEEERKAAGIDDEDDVEDEYGEIDDEYADEDDDIVKDEL